MSTFVERLRALVARHPDHHAFLFEDTWSDWRLIGDVRTGIEAALTGAGVAPDAPVGVVLRERPTCAALLAVLASGRCAVLLSSHLPDDALCDDLTTLGLAAVLTSGTTGRPSRIPLGFDALDAAQGRVTVKDPGEAAGVTINVLPLTTIGGVRGIADSVWRGRPLALLERFDVWRWAALVRDHRPRRIGVPPAVLRTLLDEGVPPAWFDGVEALTTGSAPLHVPTVRAFVDAYGIPVLNAYGSTEFGGRIAEWRLDDWERWQADKLGSVGRPMDHVSVRTVGDDGGRPASGHVGLLEVRFGDGPWIRTNDLVEIDADGFLWIEGRADDVIIRGGFKVSVSEVEEVLEAHPAVEEAIVVGLDDERLGQVPAVTPTWWPGSGPAWCPTRCPGSCAWWTRSPAIT